MSTKTHGSDSRLKNKHPLAIQGKTRVDKKKRRRSSVEEVENKRNRVEEESQSDTESSSLESDSECEENLDLNFEMAESSGNASSSTGLGADIRAEIISALADEKLMTMLSKAFAKQIVHDLNSKIKDLAEKGEEAEKRMDSFDERLNQTEEKEKEKDVRLDKLEQKEKENNVIVSGVPTNKTSKDGIRKLLNEKLKCNINSPDILFTSEINTEDGKSTVRVAFTNKDKRKQLMKAKKQLRGQSLWLSDDLTKYRSSLAYHARQAVKNGNANLSWVTGGNVFVKKTAKDKPKKINTLDDIPGYVKQN